jgi:hypothetical protein
LATLIFFIAVLRNFIKHSQNFVFADTINIACSICSATDSILAQSDIDSIHVVRAAAFMALDAEESKVQC